MQKLCVQCQQPFIVTAKELAFLEKISPRINEKTYLIPQPKLCPGCRLQRRMAHRNQIYVNLKQDPGTTERVFSMYLGKPSFPVVSNTQWWSDSWEARDYGRDFDFSRPFFEQWRELRDLVPHPALNTILDSIENSDYCNNCSWLKDCYFCFDADKNRDCLYSETITNCKDCLDCSVIFDSELCYDCAACSNCYNLQSSENCEQCSDSYFLTNCRGCKHCFGCINLRHQEYFIFNKEVSKDKYTRFLESSNLISWNKRLEFKRKVQELQATNPKPHLIGSRIENCSGNHLHNSRNIENSFFINGGEDLRHCNIVTSGAKDCQDCTISFMSPELMYECCICGLNTQRLLFCYNCWDGANNLIYCDTSHASENCFGCVCLRKQQFCILNKQYSKEDYFALLPKIVEHLHKHGEWGEFFPMQLSPWPYNYSFASRFFSLSENQAKEEQLNWLPKDATEFGNLQAQELPDDLPSNDQSIIAQCESTGRLFRITTEEIKRLRKFSAPLPREVYDQRMNERAKRCGGMKLISRLCAFTKEELRTVYSTEDAPIIWNKAFFDREFT